MGIKEIFEKISRRREKFSEMKENDRLVEKLQERKKNANERELEHYYEEARQKEIARQLQQFREQKKKEMNHSNVVMNQQNLFKNQKCVVMNNGKVNMWRAQ